MAYSIVSLDRLQSLLDYDPVTGVFTWKVATSRCIKVGAVAGSENTEGYVKINIDGQSYQAHNLAWYYTYGEYTMVDHKDRSKHNAIDNLRPTTYQLNAANRSYIGNNSGVKGVYRRGNRFEVGIKVNQKRIYVGLFETLEEAANAYAKAAKEHFGHFATSGE